MKFPDGSLECVTTAQLMQLSCSGSGTPNFRQLADGSYQCIYDASAPAGTPGGPPAQPPAVAPNPNPPGPPRVLNPPGLVYTGSDPVAYPPTYYPPAAPPAGGAGAGAGGAGPAAGAGSSSSSSSVSSLLDSAVNWVQQNPLVAGGAALVVVLVLFGGRK